MKQLFGRIYFGLVSILFSLAFLRMILGFIQGNDEPPFIVWIVFFVLPIIGFLLTTIKGEIKLQPHLFWTPLGFLISAFALWMLLIVNLPGSSGVADSFFNNSSESLQYILGLGLMLTLVNPAVLYQHAYYFVPLGLFNVWRGFVEGTPTVVGLIRGQFEWNGVMDLLWFLSAPLFLYFIYKKIKTENPGIRKIFLVSAVFVLGAVVLGISGNAVGSILPKDNWVAHWLKAQKPSYRVSCLGNDCSNPIYSDPYSGLCVEADKIGRSGISTFLLVAQDHLLLSCRYEIDSDIKTLKVTCPRIVPAVKSKTFSMPVQECGTNKDQNQDPKKNKSSPQQPK